MFNYMLLCGSEGVQNHFIKKLISARTSEEKRFIGDIRNGEMS